MSDDNDRVDNNHSPDNDDQDDDDNGDDQVYDNNDEYLQDNEFTGEDPEGVNEEEEAASRRRKGWTFWRASLPKDDKDNKDQKENKDLKETPDSKPKKKLLVLSNTIIPVDDSPEDAVLYKPHDKPGQFDKMQPTEYSRDQGSCVVPSWDECLPKQRFSFGQLTNPLTQSVYSTNTTGIQPPEQTGKMELSSWRNYLRSVSLRLGLGLLGLQAVVDHNTDPQAVEQSDANRIEQEMNLLYERTYRLYGKSLQKLPSHKRACLPNYLVHFDPSEGVWLPNSGEDEEQEGRNILIEDDPMGNLLINHKRIQSQQQLQTASDMQKTQPNSLRKIKKILIIGVHGFFPTRIIRPIIGAPKGTSLKFANEAERAVLRYCKENGLIEDGNPNHISIQKIALEKEGKIFDRVGFFTEVLMKWRQELNDADFIFIAAHSQGCVVLIILLARLIAMGILENAISKRIGILAMAGINNGPFYGSDKLFFMKAYSTIEHDSLLELFELTNFDSLQLLEYKQSLQIIVNCNVKLCFIGLVDDQLVPLYSALASHVFHPNIYRACYIDKLSNTSPFLRKLILLCCHLQNLGYFDNNVIKELSPSLAGPMTGGGHLKIYSDSKVYDVGIKFILDTDDIIVPASSKSVRFLGYDPKPSRRDILGVYGLLAQPYGGEDMGTMIVKIPEVNQVYIKEYNVAKIGSNPYILPWCLRGFFFNVERNWPNARKLLLVELAKDVGKSGFDEIDELCEEFEQWKPVSKQMKDLKFRLNGIRASKL